MFLKLSFICNYYTKKQIFNLIAKIIFTEVVYKKGFNMKIDNHRDAIHFKQIKLSRNDIIKVNKLLEHCRKENSPCVYQSLIDIFAPHIDKESSIIGKHRYDIKDISQDLYLNLIENFNENLKLNGCARTLVENLNKKIDYIIKLKSIRTKSINNLTQKEYDTLSYENSYNAPETTKELLDRLISSTNLRYRQRAFIDSYRNGYTFSEIGNAINLSPKTVRSILGDAIHNIKMRHIPKYREEFERTQQKGKVSL